MTLQEAKDQIAKTKGFNSWRELHVYVSVGPAIFDYLDEAAELYARNTDVYLLGKQVRYRYVDWDRGSVTPWATCTESDLKKFDDASIETIEFKP